MVGIITKKKKVYIVGNDRGLETMWREAGHTIVWSQNMADIIQFIGGPDVNPELYGERPLKVTHSSSACDARDVRVWDEISHSRQFSVGVCRGGQFLNVMNGGYMWQHVSNHTNQHKMIDLTGLHHSEDNTLLVTSTHHQMMIPVESGEILAYADGISANHQSDSDRIHDGIDPEVIWYDKTRCLCYQPHPEYITNSDNTRYFFNLIDLLM